MPRKQAHGRRKNFPVGQILNRLSAGGQAEIGKTLMAPVESGAARATKTRRRTRIQKEKEEVIFDAALNLFSAKGFDGVTVDQIASAAGMSKPNLLYYFARKEDIYAALINQLLKTWLEPLVELNANGDPIEELRGYLRRKLEMSRTSPRESRLFANEILQGAPRVKRSLRGPLKKLVTEKAAVIQAWIDAGQLAKVDPTHLIFAIWSTTQHYADFDVQVRAVTASKDDSHFDAALQTLETLFLDGLRVR